MRARSKKIRLGDVFTPILFNLIVEKVIRENIDNNSGAITKSHQFIGYADDINLVAKLKREIKNIYRVSQIVRAKRIRWLGHVFIMP